MSLFVKERLYIGEATVATVAGLILGPHCLGWFDPLEWGDTEYITLEICRIVLCIQIVAVAVELPRKYMKKHWVSVAIFLLPVMTCGWVMVGLFIWCLIPHFSFNEALLVSACVTATDPILAAAVVGKGKFAERVPGHLRNLLSAESGCNDGMAFPFIYLSLNLITHAGNSGEIFKEWFLLTILWECIFGCILGVVIGVVLRKAVAFAESKNLIDRESFLAIFIFIAFISAGVGSMLGVDDLLVSFAAGTAFGWNGDFAKKTEESQVSTVIDLLLNLSFFVYFGAIVPWPHFNESSLGLDVWRLILLALVIIFLRRIPAVVALKPLTPDVKSWREALFCGHFGPIGVGAIFAAILARKELEHFFHEPAFLDESPDPSLPHAQLIATIWPLVCFVVVISIIVHGSSVAVLTLGKRLNRMAITMSFTTTNTQDQGPAWMSRLTKLGDDFSLQRVDTHNNVIEKTEKHSSSTIPRSNTIETSGIKVRPAGGAKRRNHKKKKRSTLQKTTSRIINSNDPEEERQRPATEFLQLGRTTSAVQPNSTTTDETPTKVFESSSSSELSKNQNHLQIPNTEKRFLYNIEQELSPTNTGQVPKMAYQAGNQIIIEDQHGEIIETLNDEASNLSMRRGSDSGSIHSLGSLRRQISHFSAFSDNSNNSDKVPSEQEEPVAKQNKRIAKIKKDKTALYNKQDPKRRKVFAHQVDDLIVIENDQGEIIRRYMVNRNNNDKPAPPPPRERSASIVGRALSYVGFRHKDDDAISATTSPTSDLEKGKQDDVVPSHDSEVDKEINEKSKSKLDLKMARLLKKERAIPIANIDEEEDSEEEIDSEPEIYSEDSEESDDSEDGVLHESSVEKKRRLAALGRSQRGDSDEED